MTDKTSSQSFGRSAHVAYLHSLVDATETEPLIAKMLKNLGAHDPAVARSLAEIPMRRQTFLELVLWMKRLEDHPKRDRLGAQALKFWAAQALIAIVLPPTVLDQTYVYPPGLAEALKVGAEGLYEIGISQFDGLVGVGLRLVDWLAEHGRERVVFVESPLGNTVPVQFMAELATKKGISAEIVQWNAPRNDRPGRGRTVKDTAKICAKETAHAELVVLIDECLTGSRFIKLFEALLGPVGKDRLLPIAMLFLDPQRGDLTQRPERARLIKMVEEQGRHLGYPECSVDFPQRRLFLFNGENVFWQAPVIWGDSDMIAGKRKVNLVFVLIDHYRKIIKDLARPKSEFRPYLMRAWSLNDRGQSYAFSPGLVESTFKKIAKDLSVDALRTALSNRGRERFPMDYEGTIETMTNADVRERSDWLRDEFKREVTTRLDELRAGFLYNAVDAVFASSIHEQKPEAGRDLDATAYTIPFNGTIRSFNDRLIELLLSRAEERQAFTG
ncbi:hypothetical protein [Bradyrhizobium elkanii]|uniref:hypothetical protein n=1 Tax=Bradyrhizobium elkanii TaxID=29448 RepID=UPI000570045B|nr:hypothetical protein [Bradyrhizobium elkanii]WLA83232.1 hypothetical protein QNJ99_02495 [Bradyrhizobium elkanii]